MRTLLRLALAAGALWAVWSFVPVGGRTLEARWRSSPDALTFAGRGLGELRAWLAPPPAGDPDARRRAGGAPPRDRRPAERHTEADRRAVDRLVSDRLQD
ncbi:MAG TPA: hypothetical protein VLS93_10080 [Anaeromyxobacteraceae bacterium]|nr:hypothetical protein [Anaeromyxobacteraceae bacterium]